MAPPLDVQLEAGLDQALRLDRRGVHFALQPDGLGPVHLRIVRDEGSVRIHIAVEQAPTRDLVEATWPQLARACEERGVPVDRLVVELVDPSSHGANFSQSSGLPYSQRQRAPEPSTPRAPRPPVEPPHPPAELRPLVGEIHHVDYHV